MRPYPQLCHCGALYESFWFPGRGAKMVGGSRPVIRTSHEARRRSSLAVSPTFTPDQLNNLSLLSENYGRPGQPEGRRSSYEGKTPSPLPSPRRGSLQPPWPANGGPSMARRKSAFKDGKPPLRRFDTCLEIKKSRIVFTVLIAAGLCTLVALLSYAVKTFL